MISRYFILLTLLSLVVSSKEQKNNRQRIPSAVDQAENRLSNVNFPRGRCPEGFYQTGDECLYFFTGGDYVPWKQAQCICAQRINRILSQLPSNDAAQNIQPAKGARQLLLNTPEKVKILRAFLQEHSKGNFSVGIPYDYYTATRYLDRTDNDWPEYCKDDKHINSTCFATSSDSNNDICLREVPCNDGSLRLACEFTLPGAFELTASKFRQFTALEATKSKLSPMWLLLAISLIILLIIVGIINIIIFIMKRKSPSSENPVKSTEPAEEKALESTTIVNVDPATEPLV